MFLKYIALLRHNSTLAGLSLVQLICYFGAWFSHAGIFTLLIELNAPAWALSTAVAIAFIPSVLLAPFNGVIIDKLPKKPLMLALLAIESISVLMLLLVNDLSYLLLLFVLIFVRLGVGALYFQTEMSLLPAILARNHLRMANEIHSMIFAFAYTAGIGLAGIFVHFWGVKASFVFDFVLYCFGIFVLARTKFSEPELANTAKSFLLMLREVFVYLKHRPLIFHLMLLHALVAVFSYDTIVALLVDYEYKGILSVALAIGFLNMSRAFALCVGPVILARFVNDKSLFYFFIFQAFGIVLWAFLQANFYTSLLGIALAVIFCNTIWSYTISKLQSACKRKFYGRIMAYNDMLFFLIASAIASGSGLLFELGMSLKNITLLLAFFLLCGGFYWLAVSKKYF